MSCFRLLPRWWVYAVAMQLAYVASVQMEGREENEMRKTRSEFGVTPSLCPLNACHAGYDAIRLRAVTGAFGSKVYSPTFLVKLVDSLCNSKSFIKYKQLI